MSDDYAEMICKDMSSGGSSAMHLAADHPDIVNKLVMGMTG